MVKQKVLENFAGLWIVGKVSRPGKLMFSLFTWHIASQSHLAFFFILGAMFLLWMSVQFIPVAVNFIYILSSTSFLSFTGGSDTGEPYVPGVFFRQFLPVSPKASSNV